MESLFIGLIVVGFLIYLLTKKNNRQPPLIDYKKIEAVAFRKFGDRTIRPLLYDKTTGTIFEYGEKYYYVLAIYTDRFRPTKTAEEACAFYKFYQPLHHEADDYTPGRRYKVDIEAMREIWGAENIGQDGYLYADRLVNTLEKGREFTLLTENPFKNIN